jgi:hypothetical protein
MHTSTHASCTYTHAQLHPEAVLFFSRCAKKACNHIVFQHLYAQESQAPAGKNFSAGKDFRDGAVVPFE